MHFIVWIMLGGILGWIASIILHTKAQQGPRFNSPVRIICTLLAGVLITPLFGVGTINQRNFSLPALLLSLLGAIILLAMVDFIRRRHGAVTERMGPGGTGMDRCAKSLGTS